MKLEVLVGMIASGKSTYARRRADEGALVVSHDDLTSMLHARYRYEQDLRKTYRAMEEAIAREAFEAGKDVVVDRTHLTRESRQRWVFMARNLMLRDWSPGRPTIVAVTFPVECFAVHANRRFDSDPRGRSLSEWLAVAEHHAARLEPLELAEGFDRIEVAPPFI